MPATDTAEADRHRARMAKRKAVQDAEVASKTVEKGLLIVHTGPGKGKSTAAFGLALRMLGHGRRVGVVMIRPPWDIFLRAYFPCPSRRCMRRMPQHMEIPPGSSHAPSPLPTWRHWRASTHPR